jgi:hypothetical protein
MRPGTAYIYITMLVLKFFYIFFFSSPLLYSQRRIQRKRERTKPKPEAGRILVYFLKQLPHSLPPPP